MPARLAKTKKHRAKKTKKLGASSKSARENHGTTARFPLTGPIPAVRYGRVVKPETITVKAKTAAKAAAK
jgi:ribosomal protein L25 (general stress protein Ctc)